MRNELRKARLEAGLTQAQLAELAGIDRSSYTHIELGDRDPSFETACVIARILGRRVEELFIPVNFLKEASGNA